MENKEIPCGAYVFLYIVGTLSVIIGLISILAAIEEGSPALIAMDLRIVFADIFCGLLFISLGYVGHKLHQIAYLMKIPQALRHSYTQPHGEGLRYGDEPTPADSLPQPETAA